MLGSRREIGNVFFDSDHREDSTEAYDAEIVKSDGILEEGGLLVSTGRRARRVVFYGVKDDPRRLWRKIPVAKELRSDRNRAAGVVRTLPQRIGFIQTNVVQERGEAQNLGIVVEPLRFRQLLGQSEHPKTMDVAPDRVRPGPCNEGLYFLDDRLHKHRSVADRVSCHQKQKNVALLG